MTRDALSSGAVLIGGGIAGYLTQRWLAGRELEAHAARTTTSAAAPPISIPEVASVPVAEPPAQVDLDPSPVSSPTQVDGPAGLSREFDPVFDRYREAIPVEYLRALAMRESGMNPSERSGPAWGLMQIVEVVRRDYNRKHRTRYTRADLQDASVNVAMCCWLLREIIAGYQRNHPDVPNLRADWSNPRFVELLTFSWNAGFSEAGGVGRVLRYLKKQRRADLIGALTIDVVHEHAAAAGASRHLQNAKKVAWCKTVVQLYESERSRRNGTKSRKRRRVRPLPGVAR
jgi:hypothetical protein